MAATKLQFKYGSWTTAEAKKMSIETPGLVIFNYQTEEIVVGGTIFGMDNSEIKELLERVKTLEEFRQNLYVAQYAQAKINTTSDASSLTIFGIKQGEENSKTNSGKIAKVETIGTTEQEGALVINFAAKYDDEKNRIALESNIADLKSELLGSEELEKTLDTIKEIQDALINGSYKIYDKTAGKTIRTTRVVTKDAEGNITKIEYTNGETGDDKVVYATGDVNYPEDLTKVTYTKDSEGNDLYKDLTKVPSIDGLVARIDENKENIENLEAKDYVNEITIDEQATKGFVKATPTTSEDEYGAKSQSVKIGVSYGEFKTGHEAVMDATVLATKDGIATVQAIQDYIEERLTWVSYEPADETIANDVNKVEEGGTYSVPQNSELNNSLLIKSK